MAVSIGDVAKRAGVSISTVSYVLNDGPRRVRPELTQKVLAAVQDLDYRPSRIARSMVTRRSGAIGIIHAPIHYDPAGGTFVQTVLNGIAAEAQRLRHDLLLYTNALIDKPERALADVDDGRADGLIVIAPGRPDQLIDMLAERSRPMVIIAGCRRPNVPYILGDNIAGMEAAFDHLLKLGHRKIGHIHGGIDFQDGQERYETYQRLIKEHGLPFEKKWLVGGQFSGPKTKEWAIRMLSASHRPTAILAGNDQMAVDVALGARELGLCVPHDLSIVGFDDILPAQLMHPPLTTVAQPLEAFGAAAVRNIDLILSGQSAPDLLRFPTTLVVRESTAKAVVPSTVTAQGA
jgi:DNA-binding LacI/PurR family transcriptional regulator